MSSVLWRLLRGAQCVCALPSASEREVGQSHVDSAKPRTDPDSQDKKLRDSFALLQQENDQLRRQLGVIGGGGGSLPRGGGSGGGLSGSPAYGGGVPALGVRWLLGRL